MPLTSVRRKLFYAIFGPSVTVLVLVAVLASWFDVYSVRSAIVEEADVQGKLVALAVRGPLSLEDTLAIEETMESLRGNPDIVFGAVYSTETNLVAQYPAGNSQRTRESEPKAQQHEFK